MILEGISRVDNESFPFSQSKIRVVNAGNSMASQAVNLYQIGCPSVPASEVEGGCSGLLIFGVLSDYVSGDSTAH